MPQREISDVVPSSGWVNLADLDRMASAAADRAVAGVALKQGDVEKLVEEGVEEGIKRFMERVGIDDVPEFRRDLMSLRNSRVMRETLVRHGLMITLGLLITAIGTALYWGLKGAK